MHQSLRCTNGRHQSVPPPVLWRLELYYHHATKSSPKGGLTDLFMDRPLPPKIVPVIAVARRCHLSCSTTRTPSTPRIARSCQISASLYCRAGGTMTLPSSAMRPYLGDSVAKATTS